MTDSQTKMIPHYFNHHTVTMRFLIFTTINGYAVWINFQDIVSLEPIRGDGYYTRVTLRNAQSFNVQENLEQIEKAIREEADDLNLDFGYTYVNIAGQ
jgi:hypothetical protein